MTTTCRCPSPPSPIRACIVRRGWRRLILTTGSRYEPHPPEPLHRTRARQAARRTGDHEGLVQVIDRRRRAGFVPVTGFRRPARGRHRQTAGPAVAPAGQTGTRREHPDRDAGAVCTLLPHCQHAGAGSASGSGTRPGPCALRAVHRTARPAPAARTQPGQGCGRGNPARSEPALHPRQNQPERSACRRRIRSSPIMSCVLRDHDVSVSLAQERRVRMLRTALGPDIARALDDPDVVEVMLNPDGLLWVDRLGSGREPLGIRLTPTDGERIIRLVAAHVCAEVHAGKPQLSAELPETGERFEGALPPVTPGPVFAMRKRAVGLIRLDAYVADGVLTNVQAAFLRTAVRERQNILITGGTSTGKTTLANALLDEIAAIGDRVIVLEDTVELQCTARDHVPLRTRAGVVTMAELVRSTLRLRPDRIVVGEVRGAEALDLLKAWGTGHPGGIATVHAGSTAGALLRLEQLILAAAVTPPRALIAEAGNVIVYIAGRGHARRVQEIACVTGFDSHGYQLSSEQMPFFPSLSSTPGEPS